MSILLFCEIKYWRICNLVFMHSNNDRKEQGITYAHMIGIDNIMAKPADPFFVGFAEANKFDVTNRFLKRVYDKQTILTSSRQITPWIIDFFCNETINFMPWSLLKLPSHYFYKKISWASLPSTWIIYWMESLVSRF